MSLTMGPAADAPAQASTMSAVAARASADALAPITALLRCPVDGTALNAATPGELNCADGAHRFVIDAGIPCLFAPNEWPQGKRDVTDIVKQFYETTPFPNY